MSYRHWLILPLVLVAVAAGCRQTVETKPPDPGDSKKGTTEGPKGNGHGDGKDKASAGNPSVKLTSDEGILAGVVRWQGPLPTDSAIDPSGLMVNVGGAKVQAKPAPRLQVDPESKGVANAVVWLTKPPADKPLQVPPEPVKLTQREGDCEPHVLAVPKGTRLQLVSADDRANFQASGAANFEVVVQKGKPAERVLGNSGLVVIHSALAPWVEAYVLVFDHNYYAVTGPDGKFRLPPVPPGQHTVEFWHESWRFTDKKQFLAGPAVQSKVTVDLPKGKGANLEWTLSGGEK
jgi:hypothetical protein